jgi:hypothetical protein
MATTTPNFGWSVPTSTDLVKDGATAIETLGDSIDASFVDLKGGTTGQVLAKASGTDLDFSWVAQDDSNAIQNAIVDAKGDLIAATAADTPARLAVGTNGQVLTADSTAATGLAWAAVAGGGMTLLSTTTLSSTSTNISVTGGYKDLKIIISGATANAGGSSFVLRPNNASSTCAYTGTKYSGNASALSFSTTEFELLAFGGSLEDDSQNAWMIDISNYEQSTYVKAIQASGYWKQVYQGNTRRNAMDSGGGYYATTAITSVALSLIGGNTFTAGQVLIYGVK